MPLTQAHIKRFDLFLMCLYDTEYRNECYVIDCLHGVVAEAIPDFFNPLPARTISG